MRQRQSTAIALLLALLLLAGCGESSGSSSADPNETSDTTSVKGVIGFSALTLTNPFFQEIADNMQKEAQRYGYELAVVSAERDVNRQSDQIDDFIVKQVSAIVINPCDSQSIGQAIQRANKAGIPVFTNDIQYSGTVGEVISHIATDNYQGGQLAGQAINDPSACSTRWAATFTPSATATRVSSPASRYSCAMYAWTRCNARTMKQTCAK